MYADIKQEWKVPLPNQHILQYQISHSDLHGDSFLPFIHSKSKKHSTNYTSDYNKQVNTESAVEAIHYYYCI